MPQFLLGMIFGGFFAGGELLGALFMLPIAMLLFAAVGWGAYEAVIWYEAANTAYVPAAWYAWPWHWPGAHFASELFSMIPVATIPKSESNVGMELIAWFQSVPKAMCAILINVLIAMLPLYLLGYGLKAIRWVRGGGRQHHDAPA